MTKTIFILLLFIPFLNGHGQHNANVFSKIESKHEVISELLNINALRQLHVIYNYEKDVENGSISFYYNGSELKHIQHLFTRDQIEFIDKYFIWDEELIAKSRSYKTRSKTELEKLACDLGKHIKQFEEYFYFSNKKPIKCTLIISDVIPDINSNISQINEIRTVNLGCEEIEEIFNTFAILLKKQKNESSRKDLFPKAIPKIVSDELLYTAIGSN